MSARKAHPRRRIFLRILAILFVAGVLLALLGFMLFRTDPSWYRRVELTEAEQAAGQQRLLDRLATLRNEVGRTQADIPAATTSPAWRSFDIELTEDEINGVLMRWSQADPQVRAALKSIKEPHVRFLSDRVEFVGRSEDLGTLVSIELSVSKSPEGPRVRLGRPWAGRMPLSRALVEEPGEQAVAQLREKPAGVPKELIDALAALVEGERVLPIVPLPSSLQGGEALMARVESLAIRDGVLRATLRPVN